ncbi:MAG: hypothetical protein KAG37_01270, partial [Flavobacteriales bacterium]|nr:hypothetical protein [Flavobacteriales bacterium]
FSAPTNLRMVTVKLIAFDNLPNNEYIVINQFRIHHLETKNPDVVMFINVI